MKNRPSVMEMKRKYKNSKFFLTTFYSHSLWCVAIREYDITDALVKRINKTHSMWHQNGTWYIF